LKIKVHFIDVTGFSLPDGTSSGDWVREAFETLGIADEIELSIYDGISGHLPEPSAVGMKNNCSIISGSYGPVFEERPWIPPLLDFIRASHDIDAWMLGVCFGHHAAALALGGQVEHNPRGREMGSEPVFLTPEGERNPLFRGFSSGGLMNLVHKTHVTTLPQGAALLAFNRMTPVQAFSKGKTFGVQPHPEITPVQLKQLSVMYKNVLIRKEKFVDSEEHFENFLSSFRETPESMSILGNFISMVRE
jgi:GMP synthase (glutamine-hydrolysing)